MAVCTLLESQNEVAVDADWAGYGRWVDRSNGQIVADPPYPVPADWLERFAGEISRPEVEALATRTHDTTVFLCGSVENEADVWNLFNFVICLVVDDETLRHRLQTRTTNAFGKNPEELAAALRWNGGMESTYRRLGATIIDGRRAPAEIADAILATTAQIRHRK